MTYASTTLGVNVDLTIDFAQGDPLESGNDTVNGFEIVIGGSGNDTIKGEFIAETFSGGSGNDYLRGGSGNDSLAGDAGNDTIAGDSDDDTLSGGSGDDLLVGGDGQDTLIGGSGLDFYGYDNLGDLPVIAEGQTIVGLVGDLINDADGIGQFVDVAFGFAPGTPIVGGGGPGSNFSTIAGSFDGTNADSEAFLNQQPSFIFDGDGNLSFDPNGFTGGEPNEFNVVGFSVFDVEPADIEIVATLGPQ